MNNLLASIVTILGALLALCIVAGIIYGVCLMVRQAQKKDKEIEEYRKRFGG